MSVSDDHSGQANDGEPEEGVEPGLYPMRLVTRLTGLSADTIRAWERRYRAILPSRTAGNTRRFSPEEVRRLTLLRDATERGHAIGGIAQLGNDALEALIAQPEPSPGESSRTPSLGAERDGLDDVRRSYLAAVARFDGRAAFDVLMRCATFLRPDELVFQLVLPILREVGARWSHGDIGVAQEHLVSAQISGVLHAMLRIRPPDLDAPQLLVATPPGHRHEFGALVAALIIAGQGLEPLYLGVDLPFGELEWAARASRAKLVVLSLVRDGEPSELILLAQGLDRLAQVVPVWVGLPEEHPLHKMTDKVRWFFDFESFDRALHEFARASRAEQP